jgi:hypothetical protein
MQFLLIIILYFHQDKPFQPTYDLNFGKCDFIIEMMFGNQILIITYSIITCRTL